MIRYILLFCLALIFQSGFVLKGFSQNIVFKGTCKHKIKSIEGVAFELKKDGKIVASTASSKQGKFNLKLKVNTSDRSNEYLLYIFKKGYIPKLLLINAYAPKSSFKDISSNYNFNLDVVLESTTFNELVELDFPTAKIKWNSEEEAFEFDPNYAKGIQKKLDELHKNPENYLKVLLDKSKIASESTQTLSNSDIKPKENNPDKIHVNNEKADPKKSPEIIEKEKLTPSISQKKEQPEKTESSSSKADTEGISKINRVTVIAQLASAKSYMGDTINRIDNNLQRQGDWIHFGEEAEGTKYNPENKYFEGEYKNNLRKGDWIKYYPDDTVESIINFNNKSDIGTYQFFYENGKIHEEGSWNYKKKGQTGKYKEYSKKGNLYKEFQYNEQNRRDGVQYIFYPNGNAAIIANMKNDTLDWYTNFYYENGDSYLQQLYSKGILKSEQYYGDKAKFPLKLKTAFSELKANNDSIIENKLMSIIKELSRIDTSYSTYIQKRESELQEAHLSLSEKEREISLVKERLTQSELENKIKSAEANKQRLIIIGSSIIMALMTFLIIFIIKNNRKKNQINELLTKQKEEIEEKNKNITASIQYASYIQKALLTSNEYIANYLNDFFILFQPKDIVSGDFYWAYSPPENKNLFYVACCDCTGHGVPGAFMSILNISLLNEAVIEKNIRATNSVFDDVRKGVIKALNPDGKVETNDGMDGVLCSIDLEKRILNTSCSNNPIWIVRAGKIIEIEPDKMPVGPYQSKEIPFKNHTVSLQENDLIYIFTDGYADQFGGSAGKKFKNKKLQELLLTNALLPMANQKSMLENTFTEWKGNLEQVDDVLIIGIKI